MRNIKIGLIVALCVITLSLCGMLAYGMTAGRGRNIFWNANRHNYTNMQLVLEKEIPLDGIESISASYGMNSNDIYLYESESDAILIREYCNYEISENELSTVRVNGNSLEIKGTAGNHSSSGFYLISFANDRRYTEIHIPAPYRGELSLETASGDIVSDFDMELEKDFSIASSSGDVRFPSVTAANASVSTSSGYVAFTAIDTTVGGSAGQIEMRTSSGDVKIKDLTGDTKIESNSGNLTIETIAGNAQLKTTSGDMNLKELTGNARFESSSGNQTIEMISGNAQLKATSGDAYIRHIDGNLQVATSSGYVRVLEGDGERSVSTSSGDIEIAGTGGRFQAGTQSGDVKVSVPQGSGTISTTSGDVWLELKDLTGPLNISSNSGSVNVKLSGENEFEFTADTTSGDIRTFFDDDLSFSSKGNHAHGTCGANAQGNQVEIETTSGDVRVKKY